MCGKRKTCGSDWVLGLFFLCCCRTYFSGYDGVGARWRNDEVLRFGLNGTQILCASIHPSGKWFSWGVCVFAARIKLLISKRLYKQNTLSHLSSGFRREGVRLTSGTIRFVFIRPFTVIWSTPEGETIKDNLRVAHIRNMHTQTHTFTG